MTKLALLSVKAFRYYGTFQYIAVYDHMAGKAKRYHLLLLTFAEPLVLGREIPISLCRQVVREMEDAAFELGVLPGAGYKAALRCHEHVKLKRLRAVRAV